MKRKIRLIRDRRVEEAEWHFPKQNSLSSLLRTLIPAQLALRRIQNDQYRNKGRELKDTGGSLLGSQLSFLLLLDRLKRLLD
jgi:hypothetical protein